MQIRVMPAYFLVLMRFWLRVDDVVMRVHDRWVRVYARLRGYCALYMQTFRGGVESHPQGMSICISMCEY